MRFRAPAECARFDSLREAKENPAVYGVIYYFFDEENPLYAIFNYGKNEQAILAPVQKKEVKVFAATLKTAAKVRRIKP